MIPIPGISICMGKNQYEPGIGIGSIGKMWGISLLVRYRYGGYRYRFGIEDMNMGNIGIGISVSYIFFDVISVSYITVSKSV